MSFAHSAHRPERTVKQQLGDVLLGGPGELERFVRARRPHTAWRLIARELYETVELDVTIESLRSWYPDEPTQAAS